MRHQGTQPHLPRASGEVRQVLAEWTLAPVDLWAVFPSGRMASAKVKAFVAFVEAALRRDIA
ncbi:hypothetical protein [Cupriavidus sp. YAF13]|uniref:hypothetical protein n=1 Tax=Cupriavidus sp. YAF13 TaxID=3233075 RepID=UPI003F8F1551